MVSHSPEQPCNVQAAIAGGNANRLPPAMKAAVEQHGWEMARALGCLGPAGSDVTDDGAGATPDLAADLEAK